MWWNALIKLNDGYKVDAATSLSTSIGVVLEVDVVLDVDVDVDIDVDIDGVLDVDVSVSQNSFTSKEDICSLSG